MGGTVRSLAGGVGVGVNTMALLKYSPHVRTRG